MILIYSIILAAIFALLFATNIKRYHWIYYTLALVIGVITTVYEILRIISGAKLTGTLLDIEKISINGHIAIAFFILVMFIGALDIRWSITRRLLSIRSELAILGVIFILPHSLVYFIRFIVLKIPNIIKTGEIPKLYIVYIAIGIIAFIVMIPLCFTSFKRVRSRMKNVQWKSLQKWAYIFYLLIYIHIILSLFNKKEMDWSLLIKYTVVFGSYTILRLIKYKISRNAKLNFKNTIKINNYNM